MHLKTGRKQPVSTSTWSVTGWLYGTHTLPERTIAITNFTIKIMQSANRENETSEPSLD